MINYQILTMILTKNSLIKDGKKSSRTKKHKPLQFSKL